MLVLYGIEQFRSTGDFNNKPSLFSRMVVTHYHKPNSVHSTHALELLHQAGTYGQSFVWINCCQSIQASELFES